MGKRATLDLWSLGGISEGAALPSEGSNFWSLASGSKGRKFVLSVTWIALHEYDFALIGHSNLDI